MPAAYPNVWPSNRVSVTMPGLGVAVCQANQNASPSTPTSRLKPTISATKIPAICVRLPLRAYAVASPTGVWICGPPARMD